MAKDGVSKLARAILATGLLVGLLALPGRASACECNNKQPSFEEALGNSVLIFRGTVEKMTWQGWPTEKIEKNPDGSYTGTSDYIDPKAPEMPFDPKEHKSAFAGYKVYFHVLQTWKNSGVRTEDAQAIVGAIGGDCGFEQGKEYLVFAKAHGEFPPFANLCARTRPVSEAQDDVRRLAKRKEK